MTLVFNTERIQLTEFGVGKDDENDRAFFNIPVDGDVQNALRDMLCTTCRKMQAESESPQRYEPTEKHANTEYLYLPLGDSLAKHLQELHEANQLPMDAHALDQPAEIFCYFARLVDDQQRRLTAVRRASYFKGELKKRLIRLHTDTLKMVEHRVFKLDHEFDLLVDKNQVHILHPSGFEFVGKLQDAIKQAVDDNVAAIASDDLSFVDFEPIANYARTRVRAARYLASIRTQVLHGIDENKLKKTCQAHGLKLMASGDKLRVDDNDVMGFLEVLDRRRYEVDLGDNGPERYRADSRRPLDGGS